MNKGIVDSLWLEANKARGTLAMPDVCRIVIYVLFIKYIDMENESIALPSYDEKFSVGYLALIYGKKVSPKELVEYMEAIEKDIMYTEGIVSDEMDKLLKRAETNYVQKVFSIIDEAGFNEKKQLYVAASSLLDRLGRSYGNAKGITPANLSLCKLEGRLAKCQDGMRVYDGFCGYGLSASEVADGRGIVFIQDIDRGTVAIASIMALLKGNQIGAVGCGDSQVNPLAYEKYDRIVCEPPFVPRYDNGYLSSVPEDNYIYSEIQDSGSLALRHALAHLESNGTAVVLVPTGMLFKSGKGAEIRKKLAEEYIDAIVELPSGVIPNIWTATALLVLKKDRDDTPIYMLNAKDFFEKTDKKYLVINEENINKIVDMYENRKTVEGISCNAEKNSIASRKYNLCTSQYVVSNPEDTIILEDNSVYLQKYVQLARQLAMVDKKLETVRGRFTGNT